MPNRRSVEGEYRVEGSVLDELGRDRSPSAAEAGFLFLGPLRGAEAPLFHVTSGVLLGSAREDDQSQRRRTGVSDPHVPEPLTPDCFLGLIRHERSRAFPGLLSLPSFTRR